MAIGDAKTGGLSFCAPPTAEGKGEIKEGGGMCWCGLLTACAYEMGVGVLSLARTGGGVALAATEGGKGAGVKVVIEAGS